MNLTLHFVLLGFLVFSYICPSTARNHRAKRKHRKDTLHRFQGERFKLATHYLPMNGTTAGKKLIDLRGNVSSQAHNGIKESSTQQIDQVLTLDGKDDFIELKGVRDRCIVDPTDCTEGLSVAFWIKYTKGEFIISSGGYATGEFGPGFRFICQSCNKNRGPHAQSSGTFLLELSTATAKWKILLDSIPRWWFHFSFTWNRNRGLKFYKNGKLAVVSGNPEEISRYRGAVADLLTIGKPNSLKSMFRPHSYGAFSIGHFVIWTYELLSFDVEIAFMSVLTKSTNSMICCKKMKDDPCVKNPCHDGATCQRMEDKYKCICTDINNNMDCSSEQKLAEPCVDKSDRCAALANQEGYCDYHWRRMKTLCPKACKYCASQKRTEPHTTASHQKTLVPNPSPGSQNMQTPVSTSVVPTTAVLGRLEEGDNKGLSRNVLILIICAGSGGLLLFIVVLAFIFTRFYKQRKGEFVPDKTYPNCQHKQNGEASVEDVDNISSFIDPSTPRITDVPHKPTRAQGSAGGAGGGGKKQKKPMGVKVTYKPPEWD